MRDEIRDELELLLTPVVERHFAASKPDDGGDEGDASADQEDAAQAAAAELIEEVVAAVGPWLGRPEAFAGDQVPDELHGAVAEAVSAAVSEFPERPVDEDGLIANILEAVRHVLARA